MFLDFWVSMSIYGCHGCLWVSGCLWVLMGDMNVYGYHI